MENQVKAVHILHYVAVMNRAGEETFIMNVFRKINRQYVMFDFLCSLEQRGEYDDEIESLGGKIFHLSETKKIQSTTIDTSIKLFKFLKSHHGEFTAFHIHTQHAMNGFVDAIIAKISGIPKVIVHSHSTNTLYHLKAHKLFRPLLAKLKIDKFACSEEAGKWLFGKSGDYKIIKNGVDTNLFCFSENIRKHVRLEKGWTSNKIIGHIGSFTYPKNHLFLLKIFKELVKLDSSVRLVLVGKGDYEQKIIKFVSDNNMSNYVTLMGVQQNINEICQGMDLFIFPSRFEGLGIAVIEAQASGLPCLISDIIPKEVDITNYIHRASLESSAANWAKIAKDLLDKNYPRCDTSTEIRMAGYDIETTARELQNFYMSV